MSELSNTWYMLLISIILKELLCAAAFVAVMSPKVKFLIHELFALSSMHLPMQLVDKQIIYSRASCPLLVMDACPAVIPLHVNPSSPKTTHTYIQTFLPVTLLALTGFQVVNQHIDCEGQWSVLASTKEAFSFHWSFTAPLLHHLKPFCPFHQHP